MHILYLDTGRDVVMYNMCESLHIKGFLECNPTGIIYGGIHFR